MASSTDGGYLAAGASGGQAVATKNNVPVKWTDKVVGGEWVSSPGRGLAGGST